MYSHMITLYWDENSNMYGKELYAVIEYKTTREEAFQSVKEFCDELVAKGFTEKYAMYPARTEQSNDIGIEAVDSDSGGILTFYGSGRTVNASLAQFKDIVILQ